MKTSIRVSRFAWILVCMPSLQAQTHTQSPITFEVNKNQGLFPSLQAVYSGLPFYGRLPFVCSVGIKAVAANLRYKYRPASLKPVSGCYLVSQNYWTMDVSETSFTLVDTE